MNLYEILGIERSATPKEIKIAYRKLASRHHPDREGGDENKFKEIQKAYDVLSNPQHRAKYDSTGEIAEDTTDYEASAKQTLSNVFDIVIVNAIRGDIIKWCEDNLVKTVEMVGSEIAIKQNELKRLKKFKGRMRTKNNEENAFEMILDSRIQATSELIIGLEKGKKITQIALEMLKGEYEYVPEDLDSTYAYGLVQL